jgi:hypothetical protein
LCGVGKRLKLSAIQVYREVGEAGKIDAGGTDLVDDARLEIDGCAARCQPIDDSLYRYRIIRSPTKSRGRARTLQVG